MPLIDTLKVYYRHPKYSAGNTIKELEWHDALMKIAKEQRAGGWDKWATDLVNSDFATFVTDCAGLGIKVATQEELDDAFIQLFTHQDPVLLEVQADVQLI